MPSSKFEALLTPVEALMTALNKVDGYKKYCTTKVSDCDKALSDIDHILELNRLDGVKIMKLAAKRKEILLERRFYKDEIARADVIAAQMPQSQSVHGQLTQVRVKLNELEEQLQSRAYTPRVLFDIFGDGGEESAAAKQRREDLTRLGKKASKKALRMEEKFREIKS